MEENNKLIVSENEIISAANSGDYDKAMEFIKDSGLTSIVSGLSDVALHEAMASITNCFCHFTDVHYQTMLNMYCAEVQKEMQEMNNEYQDLEKRYDRIMAAFDLIVQKIDFSDTVATKNAMGFIEGTAKILKEQKRDITSGLTQNENKIGLLRFFKRKK